MKLQLSEDSLSIKSLLILIAVAYLFSLSMRYLWVMDVQNIKPFYWNNELMISNNDGYYFAEGARDILTGSHQLNDLSPVDQPISILTAFLKKVLPFSLETIILYLPAFVSSLIVIPMVLIGRALNQTTLGFVAALIASIAHSYYNRTMVGYYDTDMLNVFFPVLEAYSLILALTHQRNRYLIPITVSIALYQWWYPQAYALDSALFLIIVGYTVLFDRKNIYYYKIALFMLVGILSLPVIAKISMALVLFALFHYRKEEAQKFFWPLFLGVVVLYFALGGITLIETLVKSYLFHETSSDQADAFTYFNVVQTVREAGQIPFSTFAERISGSILVFAAACVGYLMALFAYRPLIITLPLVGLGFFAYFGGLRFTIYAVPGMALGIAYLLLFLTQKIDRSLIRYGALALLTAGVIYPNYLHIRAYQMQPVMINTEVEQLEQLKSASSRDAYVLAWWDYGFPIRYYADVKTLIDGAQHSGQANYPVSFVLTQPQQSAALMARLAVEYKIKQYEANSTDDNLGQMLKDYNVTSVDDLIAALQSEKAKLPKKTADIYLYLPLRMMDIFPTVALFSTFDPTKPGQETPKPFFFMANGAQDTGKTFELGQGVSITKEDSTLKVGNASLPIKAFYQTVNEGNRPAQVQVQKFRSEGLNVIYMSNYGKFLVVDDYYLNSSYIQMFVFDQYDATLFEPVYSNPMSKIYKLKM